MWNDRLSRILLFVIATAMVAIALRPVWLPTTAQAQSGPYPFYIEPGSELLRAPDGSSQVYGKVVVDMRTGKVWGFPTLAQQSYPMAGIQNNKPPTSRPMELGRFAFDDIGR